MCELFIIKTPKTLQFINICMYTIVEDQAPYYIRYQHPGQEQIVKICREYLAGMDPVHRFTHHRVDPVTAQRIVQLVPISQHLPIMMERVSLFITPPGWYYRAHKDGADHRCSINYAVEILDDACTTHWYTDADVLPHYPLTGLAEQNQSREAQGFDPKRHTPVCSMTAKPHDIILFNTDVFHDFDNTQSTNQRVVLTLRFRRPGRHYFDDIKKRMFGPDTLEKQREAPTF